MGLDGPIYLKEMMELGFRSGGGPGDVCVVIIFVRHSALGGIRNILLNGTLKHAYTGPSLDEGLNLSPGAGETRGFVKQRS